LYDAEREDRERCTERDDLFGCGGQGCFGVPGGVSL
jgi:hypothetical protein